MKKILLVIMLAVLCNPLSKLNAGFGSLVFYGTTLSVGVWLFQKDYSKTEYSWQWAKRKFQWMEQGLGISCPGSFQNFMCDTEDFIQRHKSAFGKIGGLACCFIGGVGVLKELRHW
jgi:hypothetical protein